MSAQWRGLHNPERHITTISGKRAMCNWEGQHNHDTWCDPVNPCYCCLAAEVEALREREAQSLDVNALLSELAELRHGLRLLQERRDIAYRTWQGYPDGTRGRKTWGKRLNALDAALRDFDPEPQSEQITWPWEVRARADEAEVEALRAQVQAVRTVTDPARDVAVSDDLWGKGWREAMVTVRSAMDGSDE